MNGLFDFNWQRDPNGYEIRKADYGDLVIAPKTYIRETYPPFNLGMQKHTLFQILADTELTQEGYLKFANNYGLLIKDTDQPLFSWEVEINNIKQAAYALEQDDIAELIWMFNQRSFGQVSIVLVPGADPKERPFLRVQPTELISALWIQLAEAAAANLKIRRCAFPLCGTPFAFGTGTGRRNTALYCSPKCQKSHEYQKRKETKK